MKGKGGTEHTAMDLDAIESLFELGGDFELLRFCGRLPEACVPPIFLRDDISVYK